MNYNVKKVVIEKWETTDGFLFNNEEDAKKHQSEIDVINSGSYIYLYGLSNYPRTGNR